MLSIFKYMLICLPLCAQTFTVEKTVAEFSSAQSFSFALTNFIFITDADRNEIYKIDKDGNTLNFTGGYGWNNESFDLPIDVYSTALNVYVTDHNNNRIQIFDKDLNFLSVFSSDDFSEDKFEFSYPLACQVSNQGDLFILDGDNNRIIKYDIVGNFVAEIGNLDAGPYALNNPVDFAISPDGKMFTADGSTIVVFDLFGNPITKIETDININKINIHNNYLAANNDELIMLLNLEAPSSIFLTDNFLPTKATIIEAIWNGNYLYVLTPDKLYLLSQRSSTTN